MAGAGGRSGPRVRRRILTVSKCTLGAAGRVPGRPGGPGVPGAGGRGGHRGVQARARRHGRVRLTAPAGVRWWVAGLADLALAAAVATEALTLVRGVTGESG